MSIEALRHSFKLEDVFERHPRNLLGNTNTPSGDKNRQLQNAENVSGVEFQCILRFHFKIIHQPAAVTEQVVKYYIILNADLYT